MRRTCMVWLIVLSCLAGLAMVGGAWGSEPPGEPPDFKVFFRDGRVEYHEVRGWNYPKGRTAIKRFRKYFPKLVLIVRDTKWFREFVKSGKHLNIINWETPCP